MSHSRRPLFAGLVVLLCAVPGGISLQCYKCTVRPPSAYSNETERLCSNFDGSERYQVECPYSTFCMKRIFEIPFQKETVHVEIRDCASQHLKYQTFTEGNWIKQDTVVDTAYEPGCFTSESEGIKSAPQHTVIVKDTCVIMQNHLMNQAITTLMLWQ